MSRILVINIFFANRSFRIRAAVYPLVCSKYFVKFFDLLSVFLCHNPPKGCFRDSTCFLFIKHFKALKQKLSWICRRFCFSIQGKIFVEGNTMICFVYRYSLCCFLCILLGKGCKKSKEFPLNGQKGKGYKAVGLFGYFGQN